MHGEGTDLNVECLLVTPVSNALVKINLLVFYDWLFGQQPYTA